MAELAVPALISGAAAIGSSAIQANAQKQAAKQLQDMAPPTLSYDEALEQSKDLLDPMYKERLEQMDTYNAARGFYGQLPADVMRRSTEQEQTSQIASLAQQMKGQSQQQALQQQQLAAQYALGRGQQNQNWANIGLNAANSWYNMTGQVPFMGNPLVDKTGNIDLTKMTTKQVMDLITSGNWKTGPSVPTEGGTSGGMTKAVQQYTKPKGINWSEPYSGLYL
jgi:hypothetical protein